MFQRPMQNLKEKSIYIFFFDFSYTNFHTAVIAAIKNLPDMPARIATTELLEKAREEAISVLSRSSLASTDISHMQELAEESRLEKNEK